MKCCGLSNDVIAYLPHNFSMQTTAARQQMPKKTAVAVKARLMKVRLMQNKMQISLTKATRMTTSTKTPTAKVRTEKFPPLPARRRLDH
jgi:hypothetical protein